MDIAISGSSGFIGNNILNHLSGNFPDHNFTRIERDYFYGDGDKFYYDIFIHCASATPENSDNNSNLVFNSNIRLTNALIFAIQQGMIKSLIYLSSTSIYGDGASGLIKENSGHADLKPYGISKLSSEILLSESCKKMNIPILCLRLPGVLGLNAKNIFIAQLFKKLLQNLPASIYNSHSLFNNAVHVDQISRFIAKLIDQKFHLSNVNCPINIGSKEPIKFSDISEIFKHESKISPKIAYLISDKKAFHLDLTGAVSLGFDPISTKDTLSIYLNELLKEYSV